MKKFKKVSVLLVSLLLMLSLVACGGKNTEGEKLAENEITQMNKFIDREGNEIALPEKADKIISLAPSITETLLNLGLEDKLIAVDKYSLDIEGINQELPIFDIMAPDAESIIALKPDIIFGTGMSKVDGADPFAAMIEMGTFVTVIPTSTSIQGIIEDIEFIGYVTKNEEKVGEIINNFQTKIIEISEKIEIANITEEKTVYFETSPAPQIYTFGNNVFLNEYLEILKVKNIFGEQEGWQGISEEQVLEKNPQIILTNATYLENPAEEIKNRAGWESIDAVKNNQVYTIDKDFSSRANENSIKAFEEMAKALYTELF